MRNHRATAVASIAGWLVLMLAEALAAETTTLTVHADRPGAKLSPLLYGIFFEELCRAGDGGIYAEMIQNRSFEDDRGPNDAKPIKAPAWTLVAEGGAKAAMVLDSSMPLNPNNPTSLRLDIAKISGGRAGVANEGFNGIALRKGARYALSLYARCDENFQGPLTVSLEGKQGVVLGSARIDGIGRQWKKFERTLTATGATAAARLIVAAASPGRLWLDMVSLFPKATWKGRANGLRPALAEMLVAMKPSFVRFPGGYFIEGDTLPNAFRWKQTIGDVAERPGHWDPWGYRSTDGLGYYEYLQMCEDLGAEPVFVINCGMAQGARGRFNVPMEQMGPWVQDALDAIEYANGPADSTWGALRAKHGHPAPFNLKYLEIGNEAGGPLYQERYCLFYDAVKARYPEITLIANQRINRRPTEILDEHPYAVGPENALSRTQEFDKYDRKGPKIYAGEYGVEGMHSGNGNLRAAVAEAAFMTGMERNADIVRMASYAPLFVNCGWWQQAAPYANAIHFDCSRAYGAPSYYVQEMFSRNRGDVLLAMDFREPLVENRLKGGAIGLGTYSAQAEFKDIKVTRGDKLLFQSDFSSDLADWKTFRGRWEVRDGVLRQTADGEDIWAIAGDSSWKDYTYTLKARKFGGKEGFLFFFHVQNDHARSWWNLGGYGNTQSRLNGPGLAENHVPAHIETGRWYDIRIEIEGARVRCFLDGKLIHDFRRNLKAMYAVASRDSRSGDIILKVVNAAEKAQPVEIDFRGLEGEVRSATATVLTSARPEDENTLKEPTKVVPASSPVIDAAARFRHIFPGHSVTVLRMKVSKQ